MRHSNAHNNTAGADITRHATPQQQQLFCSDAGVGPNLALDPENPNPAPDPGTPPSNTPLSGLQPRPRCWPAGRHLQHQHPLDPQLTQQRRGGQADAQVGAHDAPILQDLLHQALGAVDGDGKPHTAELAAACGGKGQGVGRHGQEGWII